MRLLRRSNTGEFSLTQFHEATPPYAILSHTWGSDIEEVNFEDLTSGNGKDKPGYKKIQFCGDQAVLDGLEYFWVDTCCIDKSSSAELSEAINSMFFWYAKAAFCYVYLSDIHQNADSVTSLKASKWFTRGWTLQELLAPKNVIFYSAEWQVLGDKTGLKDQLQKITKIPSDALEGTPPQSLFDRRENVVGIQARYYAYRGCRVFFTWRFWSQLASSVWRKGKSLPSVAAAYYARFERSVSFCVERPIPYNR